MALQRFVCKYEDFGATRQKAVTVDNKAIVLVRSQDGSVYALRDVCPHRGPRLSGGMLDKGCSGETPGEYIFEQQTEVLRCPWHSWEFDIKTGKSVFAPEKVRVKTYPVKVEQGDVFIEV
jgi:nitrite reductase (NADH) small subunit